MLTVIVPIYNTGKYLDKCLSSVVGQSYRDLEIILVNDCSTDQNTINVIQKWVKQDNRISLIDKKQNEGAVAIKKLIKPLIPNVAAYFAKQGQSW